jgi:hypothetical protein
MDRLNLTLDDDTSTELAKHARKEGKARAALARELIQEALRTRAALARHRKLARDYAADREDALALLQDWEPGALEILGNEED